MKRGTREQLPQEVGRRGARALDDRELGGGGRDRERRMLGTKKIKWLSGSVSKIFQELRPIAVRVSLNRHC